MIGMYGRQVVQKRSMNYGQRHCLNNDLYGKESTECGADDVTIPVDARAMLKEYSMCICLLESSRIVIILLFGKCNPQKLA
jgi:hypothetical protein